MATALVVRTVRDFSYLKGISADTEMFLSEKTDLISEAMGTAARAIAKAGKHLLAVQNRLEYGWFEAWLQAEFRFSVRHAERFMNVYSRFPELEGDNLSELENVALSGLYLLASPSTPYEAVQEVRALATVGPVSWSETEQIVNCHKGRDYADPEETRGRRPDETREAIENAQACILNIMRLPQLVFEDGIRTPAQRARLTEIVKLAKEARGYHLEALQALGYKTT